MAHNVFRHFRAQFLQIQRHGTFHSWKTASGCMSIWPMESVSRSPPDRTAAAARDILEGFAARKGSFERTLIAEALESAGGNIRKAASFLGIPLSTMYAKIKKYQLSSGRMKSSAPSVASEELEGEMARLVSRLAPESSVPVVD